MHSIYTFERYATRCVYLCYFCYCSVLYYLHLTKTTIHEIAQKESTLYTNILFQFIWLHPPVFGEQHSMAWYSSLYNTHTHTNTWADQNMNTNAHNSSFGVSVSLIRTRANVRERVSQMYRTQKSSLDARRTTKINQHDLVPFICYKVSSAEVTLERLHSFYNAV